MLLRDMPRFELAALPSEINVGHWKLLGEGIVRARIKTSLRESIGPLLKDELHLYGMALAQWSEQIVRRLEALINSYADPYRAQIHRINGSSEAVANLENFRAIWNTSKIGAQHLPLILPTHVPERRK